MSTPAVADETAPEPIRVGAGVQFLRVPNLGLSAFVGFTKHQAVHIKGSRYVPIQGIDSEEAYEGRIYDVGISWVLFQHQFLEGIGLEVGPFFRDYDLRRGGMAPLDDERLGVRALLGVYVPLDVMFLAIGIGAAAMPEAVEVDGYFRVGFRN